MFSIHLCRLNHWNCYIFGFHVNSFSALPFPSIFPSKKDKKQNPGFPPLLLHRTRVRHPPRNRNTKQGRDCKTTNKLSIVGGPALPSSSPPHHSDSFPNLTAAGTCTPGLGQSFPLLHGCHSHLQPFSCRTGRGDRSLPTHLWYEGDQLRVTHAKDGTKT
jgi:hypothetical protein